MSEESSILGAALKKESSEFYLIVPDVDGIPALGPCLETIKFAMLLREKQERGFTCLILA